MPRPDDALEILLPDADAAVVRRARDVTRFLRLLSDDAQPAHAGTVGVDLERARSELERADRADLECALIDLLRHYVSAACDLDSFAWFGEPAMDVRAAWRVVGEFELEHDWLAGAPEPGESSAALATRLLSNLERLEVAPALVALWRARLAHALQGARAGEAAFREQTRAGEPQVGSRRRALVAGLCECLLDRGAVREARAILVEHLTLQPTDVRARQLLAWTRLVLGDAPGARAALLGLRPWLGPLPESLVALREARPEWLPCLAGRLSAGRHGALAIQVRERAEVGAAVLAVFAFDARTGAQALHLDVAPGLRSAARRFCEDRSDAHASSGSPEGRLVAEARNVIDHAGSDQALRHAVGGDTSRARVLAPILDDDVEVAGWVYLEFEHHLVPGPTRLAAFAAGWRTSVLLARARGRDATDPKPSSDVETELEDGPCAQVFHALVAQVGMKLYQRRWSGFVAEDGVARLVARGGEGVGFEIGCAGRGRGLARALATGAVIAFDEPDPRLSLHERAASGCIVPLAVAGRAIGFLAVESSRRRDFKAKDVENCAERAAHAALALRVAQFGAWHGERFHFRPWFDADRADFRSFAAHVLVAARSRATVVLSGPPGVGKLVLARWIHFESERASRPFKVHGAGLEGHTRVSLFELLESVAGGTLVLDDVDLLSPATQEELLRHLERVERALDRENEVGDTARIVATTRLGLAAARDQGRLRTDLAARLDRLTLLVPPLCERREEIPDLFAAMTRRFADEEGGAPPHPTDEALALLWRQPWPENLRGLENVAYKLVLLHGGEEVRPEHLVALARRFGLQLVRKLPSRHPHPRDLLAALRTTRTSNGRVNKTRAALYLGWDPDTLVARMQSEHIRDDLLAEEAAWQTSWDEPAADRAAEAPEEPTGEA